jgi:hypothetical protein
VRAARVVLDQVAVLANDGDEVGDVLAEVALGVLEGVDEERVEGNIPG